MPLIYEDREDLYLEIERLRKKCNELEKDVDYWKRSYNNLLVVMGVCRG